MKILSVAGLCQYQQIGGKFKYNGIDLKLHMSTLPFLRYLMCVVNRVCQSEDHQTNISAALNMSQCCIRRHHAADLGFCDAFKCHHPVHFLLDKLCRGLKLPNLIVTFVFIKVFLWCLCTNTHQSLTNVGSFSINC